MRIDADFARPTVVERGETVLTVSRQPFLDAARILVSAGYNPDMMLFGRLKERGRT